MIQIATFLLPDQETAANEFLKTHKPAGPVNFNHNMLFVFWDDGTTPPEYEIADYQELLQNVRKAICQQEIALHVMKSELADLNPSHNKGPYEQISSAIHQTQDAIAREETKATFLEERIRALQGS